MKDPLVGELTTPCNCQTNSVAPRGTTTTTIEPSASHIIVTNRGGTNVPFSDGVVKIGESGQYIVVAVEHIPYDNTNPTEEGHYVTHIRGSHAEWTTVDTSARRAESPPTGCIMLLVPLGEIDSRDNLVWRHLRPLEGRPDFDRVEEDIGKRRRTLQTHGPTPHAQAFVTADPGNMAATKPF